MLNESHRQLLRTHGTLVSRVFMGLLFLFSGVGIVFVQGLGGAAGYYDSLGIPMASVLVYLVVAVKILGGGALVLGFRTDLAAAALIVFTLAATLAAHVSLEDINLFKNLAIIGGLLYVITYGPGDGWSVDKKMVTSPTLGVKPDPMSPGSQMNV